MEKLAAFTRKKALGIVLVFSIVIFLLILGRWLLAYVNSSTGLSTPEGRTAFLQELGWEIDEGSEEFSRILLPEKMDTMLEEYNSMQLAQGYDLSRHLGEECLQYSYRLTNYPGESENVYVTLYIQGRKLIAGDIHSTSLSGFMHGLKKAET